MPNLPVLIQDGAISTVLASTLYTATITVTTLTALFSGRPARRRVAQRVLEILLRRNRDKR